MADQKVIYVRIPMNCPKCDTEFAFLIGHIMQINAFHAADESTMDIQCETCGAVFKAGATIHISAWTDYITTPANAVQI